MSDNTFSIFQWNCRTISSNISYLKQYVSTEQHHILALQSLNVNRFKLPKLDGYFFPPILQYSKNDRKISTCIYIRDDLEYSSCKSPIHKELENIFSSVVKIKVNSQINVNILSVYYPIGPDETNSEWLRSIDMNESWFILGDFNVHSYLWDKGCQNNSNNRFVENVLDSGCVILNDGRITRIPDTATHQPSAIDLSLVSPNLAVNCNWEVGNDSLGSDHLPIIITLNEKIDVQVENDKVPKYCYDRADWNQFQLHLNACDESFMNTNNINEMYSNFTNSIHLAANKSIPIMRCSHKTKHHGNIWWSQQCEDAVNLKKNTYKYWIKHRTDAAFQDMKKAKLDCNRIIALAKKVCFENFCKNEVSGSNDSKKVWKKVNEMKNGFKLPQCQIKVLNQEFPTPVEKAEELAKIFAKASNNSSLSTEDLEKRICDENSNEYKDPEPNNLLFVNSEISLAEVKDAINSLGNKKAAVGSDGISYILLKHLPEQWIINFHVIINKCWKEDILPDSWKTSIIIPLLKSGKNRSDPTSYRPIALTSHSGKTMEKIILNRLTYFCEKNNIIPTNQAGFRKGRCTIDHLVKLSTQVKKQFARRKSTLATFFDVRKAYDRVWHSRLLFKLKNIGLSGHMYGYIKSFLDDRKIMTKVGNSYSTTYNTNMGIPQGSIISPLLFNILLFDLPKNVSNKVNIVQYADDIAMWINVSLKRKTSLYEIKHIQKVYQNELNNINMYMKTNGLELAEDKTNMILFNNGFGPKRFPTFYIGAKELQYVSEIKFLGVYFTSKLQWKKHINYLLQKATKSFNLLKIISFNKWGQDTKNLIHLACSLVRSKLTYGQEIYFSAPKSHLNKLQSLDSRAIKFALGIPVHTKTTEAYKAAGILPLDEYRKLSCAKYMVRASAVDNLTEPELHVRSDLHFPKRAQKVKILQTIATYTFDLFETSEINPYAVSPKLIYTPTPMWELRHAGFDIDYTDLKKNEHENILAAIAREHIQDQYYHSLKVYTDGSVLETGETGAGYVIPDLKIQNSFSLGKGYSVFTAELVAIIMVLNCIVNIQKDIFSVLLCVDSKSVLQSLSSSNSKERNELTFEIKHIINTLISRGTLVNFCWVPSHCGILFNDWADKLAKQGAHNINSINITIPLSIKEMYTILEAKVKIKFPFNLLYKATANTTRVVACLAHRLALNSWRTKYCKDIYCICHEILTINHIISDCNAMKDFIPVNLQRINNVETTFWVNLAHCLIHSPVGQFL